MKDILLLKVNAPIMLIMLIVIYFANYLLRKPILHANRNTLRSLNCTIKPMRLINKCILQLQNNFHIKLHKMKGYIKPITGF